MQLAQIQFLDSYAYDKRFFRTPPHNYISNETNVVQENSVVKENSALFNENFIKS